MSVIAPKLPEAYQLMHDGILSLAQAERYGICVDVDYCKTKLNHIDRQITWYDKRAQQEPEVEFWKKKYKYKFNLNSDEQLNDILYNELKITPPKYTEKTKDLENEEDKKGAVDKEALSQIDLPFIKFLLESRRLKTVWDDLNGIIKEQVNGILHPHFNLHLADTYRSTSSDPNFQNMPIRDPLQGKIIRSAFLPRYGHILLEIDFGGIEVKVAACYHKDPTMLDYLHDPDKDMHKDMAAQIYLLEKAIKNYWEDKTPGSGKDVRYCAKNKYVFPEFYGSYYVDCARNLWDSIRQMHLKSDQNIPLYDWLKSQGIRNYKAFEKHIKDVEKDFWERRFSVYRDWKDEWYEEYLKKGYFDTLTGFRCGGVLRRNQVINYPVQGSAFHCLLWSFIQITNQANKRGWISRPVGQIHDSIILDVHPKELNEVMRFCTETMSLRIRDHWPWLIVPMEVESEICGIGKTWHDKKKLNEKKCDCGIDFMWKGKNGFGYECPICQNILN